MEMFLLTVVEYASIWAPSLVAILGVVATVLCAINKVKDAISDMKADRTLLDVKEREDEIIARQEEIAYLERKLLDKITTIENYAQIKSKE